MIYKRRKLMILTIIIYGGVIVMLLPRFLSTRLYPSELINELFSYAGLLIIIAAVIWFFSERIISRIDSIYEASRSLQKEGIEEISILYSEGTRSLIRSSLAFSSIRLMINLDQVNKIILEIFDVLYHEATRAYDAKIIIGGTTEERNMEDSFESGMLFQILNKIEKGSHKGLTIRITPKHYPNSFFIARNRVYLMSQYDTKGLNMIQIEVDSYSDIGREYRKIFEEQWDQASEYKAV